MGNGQYLYITVISFIAPILEVVFMARGSDL